jgi:hypothetical protein
MSGPKEKLEASSTQSNRSADDRYRESRRIAEELWKRITKNVGVPAAKEMVRNIMGDKKPGPPNTDERVAMNCFIYAYLLHWGTDQSDGKIAKRIFESEPYYLELDSGAVIVVNKKEFSESFSDLTDDPNLTDDPIISRRPITMSLGAIEKRVERLRRWAIKEDHLSKCHAPRQYTRDQ